MDQHLLPPYAPTTMDLKTPSGQLPVRFQPIAPKSTAPMHADENRSDRCGGSGLCRTVVLCVLALAICGGFVLLYLEMRNLERQVQELRELTYEGGSYGPFDDDETETEWTSHSKQHNKNRDQFPDKPEWNLDDDDLTHHKGHSRGRRSASGSTPTRGRVAHHRVQQEGEPSAHVVASNAGDTQQQGFYPISAWFIWTDQESRISHANIPLHTTGKFLLAPHSGYYYVYSQVTLMSCDNETDSTGRGHSLYVKTGCGQQVEKQLTHTITTPYIRNGQCTYDTGYIGGVYYLEQYDHVGVKPFVPNGVWRSRIFLTPTNSYFGMILISKFTGTQPRCYPRQL